MKSNSRVFLLLTVTTVGTTPAGRSQ